MINLNSYTENIFGVYQTAVARKQDEGLKGRLTAIAPAISACYDTYRNEFNGNTLANITAQAVGIANINDLKALYSYKSFVIRSVRKNIRDAQVHVISDTCQNCTINAVNSMDHFLPVSAFPEFAVNPINLFPSCTECNGKKNDYTAGGGNQRFLNLYLDQLPAAQYLFATITRQPDDLFVAEFAIRNTNNIDAALFHVIQNHYSALNLPHRMRLASVDTVTNVMNQVRIHRQRLPVQEVLQQIEDVARENMIQLGSNHFKHILEIALIQDAAFINSLQLP